MSSNINQYEERFIRHRGLAGFSPEIQAELQQKRVFLAGVGGLGGLAAAELTAVGVGHFTFCDDGLLEESNLNRQIFYRQKDMDRPKAQVLAERMAEFAPQSVFRSIQARISEENAAELIDGCDLVLDCFDNDASRFILNRAAVAAGIPIVHGGIRGWSGEAALLIADEAPCFACLRAEGAPKPDAPIPVIAVAAAQIATMQATIAVRYLIGRGEDAGRLLLWDGGELALQNLKIRRNPECPVCG